MKQLASSLALPKAQPTKPAPWWERSPFFIRLLNWEYWPAKLTNLPVLGFWLYFAIKARHLFYFSAANPAIETGGVLGESKIDILHQIPAKYKPTTIFLPANSSFAAVLQQINATNLDFPLIIKPNVGERGRGVEKITSEDELAAYLSHADTALIIQAYIDFPEEYSVLHYRFPDENRGKITSLCHKVYLSVTGDGETSLRGLIKAYPRALLQLSALEERLGTQMEEVPGLGEKVLLMPIGNHARGTMFIDANAEIDQALTETFDHISRQLEGIYVCRYDLKCESLAALKRGEGFKILEINGVVGEPAHIYHPNYPVGRAYRDLFDHWRTIYEVGVRAHSQGVPYMSFKEGWGRLWDYVRYLKDFKQSQTGGEE